jgi:hypothetical protein
VTLTLTNESDEPIDDLRVRLPGASRVWRIAARAEFLPPAERRAWERAFEPLDTFVADSVMLPKLAQLPAGQTLTVSVYGDVASAKAEIVAAKALRVATVPITRVYDRGLVAVALHLDQWKEWWTALFVPLVAGPLGLLLKWVWSREIASARKDEREKAWGLHIFTFGKFFAGKGDEYHPAATALAIWAAESGYTKQQIRDEEAFRALWADPMFRAAFGEPAALLPGLEASESRSSGGVEVESQGD